MRGRFVSLLEVASILICPHLAGFGNAQHKMAPKELGIVVDDIRPEAIDQTVPPKPIGPTPPDLQAHSIPPIDSIAEEENATKHNRFRMATIILALYLTVFIAALDQTIIATAIPTITSSLNSASGYTWIGGAYLIANAAAGPIWTKLSDIWGRKPLLLGSVVSGLCD